MKFVLNSKSVGVVIVATTLCTATGYLIYTLFKRDDEENEVSIKKKRSPKLIEIEVMVPNEFVGALIGRNGNNIRQIEEITNALINFDNSGDKDSEHRICIIRGSQTACEDAQAVIKEFIGNQPKLEDEVVVVPQEFIPKIIGRCGEEITKINLRSKAKIFISNDPRGIKSKITLTGTREQIDIAKEIIQEIIERCRIAQDNLEVALAKREPRLKSPSPKLTISENSPLETSPSPKLTKSENSPLETSPSPKPNPVVESISPLLGKSDTQYVYVSALTTPSQFWIQIYGTKAAELDKLVEKMTESYGNEETRKSHALNSVQIGDRVAAVFECDKKWYRAEVVGLPTEDDPRIELFYVDYGDFSYVPINEICSLPTDFLELNFQAIECCLSKIEPVGGKWSDESIELFEELTQVAKWKKLVAVLDNYSEQPKSDGSPVPGITLYDSSGCKNIAEALVNNGYAVFKEQKLQNDNPNTHSDNECNGVNK